MRNLTSAVRTLLPMLIIIAAVPMLAQDLDEANRLAAEGDFAGAIPIYQSYLADHPDDGSTWYALGRATHSAGKLDDAREAFERALDLGFQPGGAQLRLGTIALARGDEAAARNWFQKAFDGGLPVQKVLPMMPGFDDVPRSAAFDAFLARLHPCGADEYRQFDFWIGDWNVFDPAGQKVGENRIEKILDGCALAEFWTGGFSSGRSYNRYDSERKQWVQHWLTDTGTALDMWGGLVDGVMVLETEGTEASPKQRWSWNLEDDGSVRQKAVQLDPESGEWTVVWDSYYRKK